MEEPNRPIGKKPPERLYHYTPIDGLKGIFDSRCFWTSQIHFLNDTQEFKYSFDILKKLISEFKDSLPKKRALPIPPLGPEEWLHLFYDIIERMYFESDRLAKTPVCVFSFSEWGDLLSQWRGYCPPSGGYSIGFRSELLVPWLETKKLLVEPCIYDTGKQEAIIRDEIIKKSEKLKKLIQSTDPIKIIVMRSKSHEDSEIGVKSLFLT